MVEGWPPIGVLLFLGGMQHNPLQTITYLWYGLIVVEWYAAGRTPLPLLYLLVVLSGLG